MLLVAGPIILVVGNIMYRFSFSRSLLFNYLALVSSFRYRAVPTRNPYRVTLYILTIVSVVRLARPVNPFAQTTPRGYHYHVTDKRSTRFGLIWFLSFSAGTVREIGKNCIRSLREYHRPIAIVVVLFGGRPILKTKLTSV